MNEHIGISQWGGNVKREAWLEVPPGRLGTESRSGYRSVDQGANRMGQGGQESQT